MIKDYQIQILVNATHIRHPIYRIWIDNELMCERTFWPDPLKFYINETLIVALNKGEQIALRFESVNSTLGNAWMERVIVTDVEQGQMTHDYGFNQTNDSEQNLFITI